MSSTLCVVSSAPPVTDRATAIPQTLLHETYGALLIGTSFGLMLYGLTLHQYYRYARTYRQDALRVKVLAFGIFVLETLHTVCCVAAIYYHLVSNYFNPIKLATGHWSTKLLIPVTGLSILLCQSFYALRLCRLGPEYACIGLVVVTIIAMVCEFGFVLALTIEGFRLSFHDFQHVMWLVCSLAGCAMFIDICLMGTHVAALMKSKTGYNRMDSLIDVLIIYSINAVYANSVLAVLNCRQSLSNRLLQDFELDTMETDRSRLLRDSEASFIGMNRRPGPQLSNLEFVASFGSHESREFTRESAENNSRGGAVGRDVQEVEASDSYGMYSAYLQSVSVPDASPISHT
ncbi:hypothetical protein FKP32DRAFT_1760038 [Trametes sanguinea]|nr:hypothetical protein FKP32DRAFT_1760038 [Trametes sanguinea]